MAVGIVTLIANGSCATIIAVMPSQGEPAAEPVKAKRGRKAAAPDPEPAAAPKKRGRPAKIRPEAAQESAPQRPEPMFD